MRIILKVQIYTHTNTSYVTISVFLNINQRLVLHSIILIQKILHGMLPLYLFSKIIFVQDIHNYDTRYSKSIYVPTAQKMLCKIHCFINAQLCIIQYYNTNVTEINNLCRFRTAVSTFVKLNYTCYMSLAYVKL